MFVIILFFNHIYRISFKKEKKIKCLWPNPTNFELYKSSFLTSTTNVSSLLFSFFLTFLSLDFFHQPTTHQQARSRRSAYAPADELEGTFQFLPSLPPKPRTSCESFSAHSYKHVDSGCILFITGQMGISNQRAFGLAVCVYVNSVCNKLPF